MKVYDETKDPSETKDYVYDWSAQLSSGETIDSRTVTLVDAAGASNTSSSISGALTRVWLAGGTHGLRCLFTVQIVTSGGRTLEESFGVDIVDSVIGPASETEIERLTREIAEIKAQRVNVALGNAVIDIWRDGRRLRKHISSIAELDALVRTLEAELSAAQVAAGAVTEAPRRRSAIGGGYY